MVPLTSAERDGLRDRVEAAIPVGMCSPNLSRGVAALLHRAVWFGVLPSFREVNRALDDDSCLGCTERQGHRARMSECLRLRIIQQYGPALPTAEAFAAFEKDRHFLEVGATTGLWSAILVRRDANVIVCAEPDSLHDEHTVDRKTPMVRMDARTMTLACPDRTILMVWPDQADWPLQVLEAMQPGQRLVAVTEGRYGHFATEDFFDYLRSAFWCELDHSLPHWIGTQDYLHIHVKR